MTDALQRAAYLGTILTAFFAASAAPALAQQELTPKLTSTEDISEWTPDGNGTWIVSDGRLVLQAAGVPDGPIRRPAALAVLGAGPFVRASITVDLRSTAPAEVRQRDLQLIVGYESPSRFYYVHLSGITDAVHNGIFLVADADRRRIDAGEAPPQLTDQSWHTVRLDWDGNAGTIAVFVDGSAEPVLKATDTTLKRGRLGFGSFDDTGEFRNIRIRGWR